MGDTLRVTANEGVTDPVVSRSLNRAVERGQNGTKEKAQEVSWFKTKLSSRAKSYKLFVRVAERK